MKAIAGLSAVLVSLGFAASAANVTYDISFATGRTPDPALINFTLDWDEVVEGDNQTAGLTVNSINFPVDIGIGYYYSATNDLLALGGLTYDVTAIGAPATISVC